MSHTRSKSKTVSIEETIMQITTCFCTQKKTIKQINMKLDKLANISAKKKNYYANKHATE